MPRPPRDMCGASLETTVINIETLNLKGGFESKKYEMAEKGE